MTPEDLLTNDIIKSSLLKDRGSAATLLKWSQESCTKIGENYFNVVNRVHVTFIEDGIEKTTSYVSKLNPCKPKDSFNAYRHRAVVKEVFFYTELLPLLNAELKSIGEAPLKVPRCLYGSSREMGREVIVFQDLALLGYKVFDSKSRNLDASHSELMAKELSRIHAASFLLKKKYHPRKLSEVFPLLVESWWVEEEPELSVAFSDIFVKGIKQNMDVVAALETYDELIPGLQNLSKHGMDFLKRQLHKDSPEWEFLCHGDYHKWNVLFRNDDNDKPLDIMVLDWQTVRMASIGSELGYLGFSSYVKPERDNMMPLVLKTYFDNISRLLGPSLPFSLELLEKCVSGNHFGLLLCFYLIPMSLCVSNPSELFLIQENSGKKKNIVSKEKGLCFLKGNDQLRKVVADYLEEILKRNLDVVFRQLVD